MKIIAAVAATVVSAAAPEATSIAMRDSFASPASAHTTMTSAPIMPAMPTFMSEREIGTP